MGLTCGCATWKVVQTLSLATSTAEFTKPGTPTSELLVSLGCDFSHCLGFPDISVGKESACNAGNPNSIPGKIHWRRGRLPTAGFLGFPVAQLAKNPPAMWETWV